MFARISQVLMAVGLMAAPLQAADLSFEGTFDHDAGAAILAFEVAGTGPSLVNLQSFGYGGGIQADGTVVTAGGFDTIVTVYGADGMLRSFNDDGAPGSVATDANTGSAFDFFLQVTLAPGSYTAAVTQFNYFAAGPSLSDGFAALIPGFAGLKCNGQQFCDAAGNSRSSAWAVDITGAAVSAPSVVPVPASFPLMLVGFAAFAYMRRRS